MSTVGSRRPASKSHAGVRKEMYQEVPQSQEVKMPLR